MTRHENILSFDEARARGSVSSDRSSSHARSAQHQSRSSAHSPKQPQRLTYDPSFEQSFTATARSGSYNTVHRSLASSMQGSLMSATVHPSGMPARRPTGAASRRASSATASHRQLQPSATGGIPKQPTRSVRTHAPQTSQVQRFESTTKGAQAQDRGIKSNSTHQEHEAQEERREKKSLAHRMRAAKAERQFNKAFGSDEPVKPSPEQTSRPALYEMKMGKSHKRSSRMQSSSSNTKRKGGILSRIAGIFSFLDPRSDRFSSRALISCATLVLAVVLLYQPVANYYQEIRQQQQLEAEYKVVSDYYSTLKSEVEYLNTKEGLEEYVRQELGWVKAGEQVVAVEGLEARDATAVKGSVTSDLSNSVPTPATWYSPVLDVVFGYRKA